MGKHDLDFDEAASQNDGRSKRLRTDLLSPTEISFDGYADGAITRVAVSRKNGDDTPSQVIQQSGPSECLATQFPEQQADNDQDTDDDYGKIAPQRRSMMVPDDEPSELGM